MNDLLFLSLINSISAQEVVIYSVSNLDEKKTKFFFYTTKRYTFDLDL